MITQHTQGAAPAENADVYNYASFDFGSEAAELARWQREGPRIGDPAPEFELADLDGNRLRLSDLRGRPVVLEFGSYTCLIFSDRVAAMEQLANEHPEASFVVIYVREAHPGEIQGAHRTLVESVRRPTSWLLRRRSPGACSWIRSTAQHTARTAAPGIPYMSSTRMDAS